MLSPARLLLKRGGTHIWERGDDPGECFIDPVCMGVVKLGLRLPRQPLFFPFQDPRKKYQPGSHPAWGSLGEPH